MSWRSSVGIDPKTTIYRSNGSGRDKFISTNGGGFLNVNQIKGLGSTQYLSFKFSQKPRPSYSAKVIHYPPTGSGRDNYIIINSGGVTAETSKNEFPNIRFQNALRNYTQSFYNQCQYQIDHSKQRELAKYQAQLTGKLSQPKIKNIPYHIHLKRPQSAQPHSEYRSNINYKSQKSQYKYI